MELFLSSLSTILSLLVLLFIVMMWSLLLLLLLLLLLSMFVVTTRGAPNYNLLRHDKRKQEKRRDCQKLRTLLYCSGDRRLWSGSLGISIFAFLSISRIKYNFEIQKQYSL